MRIRIPSYTTIICMRTRRPYQANTKVLGNGPPHIQQLNRKVRHTLNTDDVVGLRSTRLSVLGTNPAQSEHEGDAIKIDPQFIKAGDFQ